MLTERRQRLVTRVSSAAAICLALAGLFVTGCDRPPASDAPKGSVSPTPRSESTTIGVVLRADPNPVLSGNPDGKTIVTWDTGSDAPGEVYVRTAGDERLFASGAKGSQEAAWIKPGSTEFRLYTQADHKLLAQLTITMPSSNASASAQSTTPVSSANP
jgi:hypothetical protein